MWKGCGGMWRDVEGCGEHVDYVVDDSGASDTSDERR
jgi:hypothetical protein